MEVLQWIVKYWIEWICVIVSGGIVLFTKHYIKIQKQMQENKWKEKEATMCNKIIEKLEEEITAVEVSSQEEDEEIHKELDNIHQELNAVESGILSLQGKQFRDLCERLLTPDHYISLDEYEVFEAEYEVYKHLGGNHRGDSLHDSVVHKFTNQL